MSALTGTLIGVGILIFIGAIIGLGSVVSLVLSREGLNERLGNYAMLPENLQPHEEKPQFNRVRGWRISINNLLHVFASEKLNMQLLSANWPITVTEFLLIRFWLVVGSFGLMWLLTRSPIPGIGAAMLTYLLPPFILKRSIYLRQVRFQRQLVDVLMLLAGSVRAGYSLQQSLDFVIQEIKPPASEEFKRVQYEVSLGLSLNQALTNLSSRMQSDDLHLLVSAININMQVGGNLVTMLNSVTNTIRERNRLFSEVRAICAQQRFSSYILTLLPFGIGGVLFLLNPEYIKRLFTPGIWLCFPIGALISVMIGNMIIRKIVNIEI